MKRCKPCTIAVASSPNEHLLAARLLASNLFGFAVLWTIFYCIFHVFPYLSAGADVVYRSKLHQEMSSALYPANHHDRRVLIFGNSKVLAGFIPAHFDNMAAAAGLNYYSYNSGYPAREYFVPQLKKIVESESGVPDIILLTLPWGSKQEFSVFHPIQSDHDLAERLFPFRYLIRDSFSFLITSRRHGGLINFYRESRLHTAKTLDDRGYYFVSEQSHFQKDSLPDDFHLATDRADSVLMRTADSDSLELKELNQIIKVHHIQCYFVPQYLRVGESAPAVPFDQPFANLLGSHSSCKLLGPDYYSYANRLFSDPAHLNREGAKIYTQAIFELLAKEVAKGH